jgi:hypothetical protein
MLQGKNRKNKRANNTAKSYKHLSTDSLYHDPLLFPCHGYTLYHWAHSHLSPAHTLHILNFNKNLLGYRYI